MTDINFIIKLQARQGMKHILQMIREKRLRERMGFMQPQTAWILKNYRQPQHLWKITLPTISPQPKLYIFHKNCPFRLHWT